MKVKSHCYKNIVIIPLKIMLGKIDKNNVRKYSITEQN